MEILIQNNGNKGRFYIEEAGKSLAEMTFVWAGTDRIIIDHTEVGLELKGKGAGKQLVEKAVQFARKNNIKIIPLCPFAKSVLSKSEEYKDIL
jgi:predicted GNAT family acetyltransferase